MSFKQRLKAYEKLVRLDKPIGILLLLWPTLWALWLSSLGRPDWRIVWIFVLGTVLMRSAGCAVNDVADSQFDGKVQRTSERPIVTGEVSRKEALAIAALLAAASFLLITPLPLLVIWLSFGALALAVTYPFTKRFFALPQAYLGLAFGFGIPMAYAAHLSAVPPVAWILLLANVFWAIAYDTEYAMVDREDDLKIGIRTSAITFGKFDVAFVMLCYAGMIGALVWVGCWMGLHWPYYIGLGLAACIALYHYVLIRRREREQCFKAFLHNNWIGAVIFLGIVFEYALRVAPENIQRLTP